MDFQQKQIKALNREVREDLGLIGTLEEELLKVEEIHNHFSALAHHFGLKLNEELLPKLKQEIIDLYRYE